MGLPNFDQTWSLFLDRDGVLNRRLPGGYVRSPEEFEWLAGVREALACFAGVFGRILVVTNQQGIGKGLMNEADLAAVHESMLREAVASGGRIDGVYHCPDLASARPNCRKPAPALAQQAQRDFPAIDFSRSVMVGDSLSDMEFGQRLGMFNVLVATKAEEAPAIAHAQAQGLRLDLQVGRLADFAALLQ
jgi:D-glycero-D-manno-heptose 1,7-bisphosphate phosphatase